MKRTKHRELRDIAHLWACRHWHFQDIADFECRDDAQNLADIAADVERSYLRAARFEANESEAVARAESLARLYDRAFSKLPKLSREHAEEWIPRTVPVFRKLRRGQLWAGQIS